MLALRTKIASFAIAGAMAFSTVCNVSTASAQTPPSQRYQPVVQDTAPPSVHVPPSNLRAIGSASATHNLSDQNLPERASKYSYHRGTVQQTTYQAPAKPSVPAILRNAAPAKIASPPTAPTAKQESAANLRCRQPPPRRLRITTTS